MEIKTKCLVCGKEFITTPDRLSKGMDKCCCRSCYNKNREKNLVGLRFGKLLVVKQLDTVYKRGRRYLCLCDCGNYCVTFAGSLKNGDCVSCGCYNKEAFLKRITKHNKCYTRLYTVWRGMKSRCNCKTDKAYKNYGGRGIKVCDEWYDFLTFEKWAFENGYDENAPKGECTIDRIDVNGNYEPSNCRWVDRIMQNNNTRRQKTKKIR